MAESAKKSANSWVSKIGIVLFGKNAGGTEVSGLFQIIGLEVGVQKKHCNLK